jgi:hypothetical protein
MKKALLLVCVLALALGITYLLLHKNSSGSQTQDTKDVPLSVSSKTSAFNRSFANVLNDYFQLSEDFITGDTSRISATAARLSQSVDSIRFDQFKADTSVVETAISLAQSIPGEIAGLKGEKTLEGKKREFNMITADLYSLIRVVKYDGSIIYHMSCATAFADSTAGDWLSATKKITNPYEGGNSQANKDKSSDCGELKDSLHFTAPTNE